MIFGFAATCPAVLLLEVCSTAQTSLSVLRPTFLPYRTVCTL